MSTRLFVAGQLRDAINGVTKPRDGANVDASQPALLQLDRIVRDKWEYDGLHSLGWYMLYALLSIAMIRSHWDGKAARGRSHVLATFQAYGDPDFNQSLLAQKETMYDAADHMLRYLHYYVGKSTDRGLPDHAVYLTEYVQVKFARIIANVGKNCRYVGMWVCGYVGMWVCGYVGMWVCGYVGMWVCGSREW
jgi:hypothetical protein